MGVADTTVVETVAKIEKEAALVDPTIDPIPITNEPIVDVVSKVDAKIDTTILAESVPKIEPVPIVETVPVVETVSKVEATTVPLTETITPKEIVEDVVTKVEPKSEVEPTIASTIEDVKVHVEAQTVPKVE